MSDAERKPRRGGLELVRASRRHPQESDHTAENQRSERAKRREKGNLEAEGTAQAKPNRVRGLVKAGWGGGRLGYIKLGKTGEQTPKEPEKGRPLQGSAGPRRSFAFI